MRFILCRTQFSGSGMTRTSKTALTLHRIESEPRVLDTDLAEALGYAKPTKIRELIARHMETLLGMGSTVPTVGRVRGQTFTAHHLNKPQALFIITKAETTKAVEVTVDMIEKFVAYEAGLMQPKAALPDFSNPVLAARAWADELEAKMLAQAEVKVLAAEVEGLEEAGQSRDGW